MAWFVDRDFEDGTPTLLFSTNVLGKRNIVYVDNSLYAADTVEEL
jgi:hypothetical protein